MEENMNLDFFVDQLVKEKDLSSQVEDPEILTQIKEDLIQAINEQINAMIIAEIAPDQLEELGRLSEAEDENQLSDFIAANIPDLSTKLVKVLTDFRNTYLGR